MSTVFSASLLFTREPRDFVIFNAVICAIAVGFVQSDQLSSFGFEIVEASVLDDKRWSLDYLTR